MKFRYTLIFAVILALLGAYVYLIEIRRAEQKEKAEEEARRVVAVDWDAVETIRLENEHGSITLRRDVESGEMGEEGEEGEGKEEKETWRLVAPIETEADQATVKSLVNALKDLKNEQEIEEEPEDPGRFGLAEPQIEVTVKPAEGKGEEIVLHVGEKSPVGSNSYLMVGGEDRILLGSADLEYTLNKELFDLREKRVVAFQRTELKCLKITSEKGTLALEKEDTSWKLTQPMQARATESEVNTMITALTSLRVEEFREEESTDLASYGLAHPRLTAELTLGDDKAVKRVLLGNPVEGHDEQIFAKRAEKPQVYVVRDKVFTDLSKDVEKLRDRKVLDFKRYQVKGIAIERPEEETIALNKGEAGKWRIASPIEARADGGKVSELLTTVGDLEAKDFLAGGEGMEDDRGFTTPHAAITLTKDEGEVVARLILGKEKRREKAVFARSDLDGTDYLVSAELADFLPEEAKALRNMKVLDFARYRVNVIDIARGEENIVLEKNEHGAWEMKEPEEQEAVRGKVDDLLSELNKIEAKGFIKADETSYPLYGLVKPNVMVTLLTGDHEEELARLLVGGKVTDSDDIYVKWTEEPWVCVVDGSFLESLPSGPEAFVEEEDKISGDLDTPVNDD